MNWFFVSTKIFSQLGYLAIHAQREKTSERYPVKRQEIMLRAKWQTSNVSSFITRNSGTFYVTLVQASGNAQLRCSLFIQAAFASYISLDLRLATEATYLYITCVYTYALKLFMSPTFTKL